MSLHTYRTALCATLLAMLSTAQDQGEQPEAIAVTQRAFGAFWQDGILWADGPGYRARFDENGMEYTPALGRSARTNHPLRLSLSSIERSSDVIWSADTARPARPILRGSTAVFSREGGIEERYAAGPDGLELSFAFPKRLPGSGDLIVRLAVETDLPCTARGMSTSGFVFERDELGGVTIGSVTGIDAGGDASPGWLRFDGSHLELALPGAFVDHAGYPLILDPPIGTTWSASGGGLDKTNPDVAYDATTDTYLVAWERVLSLTDIDIRGQRMDGSGNLIGIILPLRLSPGTVSMNPTVSNSAAIDRFLVAWQESVNIFGPWDIKGLAVDAANGFFTSTVSIAASASVNEIDPDAANESTSVDDDVLLVYDAEGSGIQVAEIDITAAPFVKFTTSISTGGTPDSKPSISKTCNSSGEHLVAWERRGFGIRAACVNRDAAVIVPLFVVNNTTLDALEPDVDGDGTDFVIAWQQWRDATKANRDIWCVRLRCQFGAITQMISPLAVDPHALFDEVRPAVSFLGPKVLIAWSREIDSPSYDIRAIAVDPATCLPCGFAWSFTGSSSSMDTDIEIASKASGGASDDDCLLVWTDASITPPFDGQVRAQRFSAFGSSQTITDLGGGCGLGGTASANGPFVIGNSTFQFTLTGADPSATLSALMFGLPGPTIPCGSCTLVNPIVQVPWPVSSGQGFVPMPLPCDPLLLGAPLVMQWWVLSSVTPCPLGPTLSASNMLLAVIDD